LGGASVSDIDTQLAEKYNLTREDREEINSVTLKVRKKEI